MSEVQCFKIKRGTKYDQAVKKHFSSLVRWKNVIRKIGELLGESITKIAQHPGELYLDLNELKNEENKKLFTKEGKLKGNVKKAKQLSLKYKNIIDEEQLTDFQALGHINFTYGVMRYERQQLKYFVTSDDDIYYKADFNLGERAKGLVIPITEIEYEEKYLEELKKRETK